jgi:hypothetical protein
LFDLDRAFQRWEANAERPEAPPEPKTVRDLGQIAYT